MGNIYEQKNIGVEDVFSPEFSTGHQLLLKAQQIDHIASQSNINVEPSVYMDTTQNLREYADTIKVKEKPKSPNEVFTNEMQRLVLLVAVDFEESTNSTTPDFEKALNSYGMNAQDVEFLPHWLSDHKEQAINARKKLFELNCPYYEYSVPTGLSKFKNEGEEKIIKAISLFDSILKSDQFINKPGARDWLESNFVTLPNVQQSRSYIAYMQKVVSIGLDSTTYLYDGKVYLNPYETISLLGHEISGHGFNHVATQGSQVLPAFIKYAPLLTGIRGPIAESVAHHFENSIYDYFFNHPEEYKKFGFEEDVDQMYYRHQLLQIVKKYDQMFGYYGIAVLGRSIKTETNEQIQELEKFTIFPKGPRNIIDFHQRNNFWDTSTNKLKARRIGELRYVFNDVSAAIDAASAEQKESVEESILTGYWTRQGFKEWIAINHPDLHLN